MTAATYALVVLSAAGHAWWNFLLKRSGGTQAFIGLSKVAEALLLAPLLVFGLLEAPGALREHWPLPVVGAALVLANYVLLTAAYRRGDLSLVYPLARGGMLVFLPPLAYLTIGERLDRFGWAAVLVIVAGIVFLQLQRFDRTAAGALGRSLATPAISLALLAALVAAGYTVWDKRAVQLLSPVTYFAAYTVLVGIGYGLLLRRQVAGAEARAEWRRHWRPILEVAVLNSASYLLALAALRTGKASLVIALRQLSIPAGACLGWWLLGKTLPPPRRLGSPWWSLAACCCRWRAEAGQASPGRRLRGYVVAHQGLARGVDVGRRHGPPRRRLEIDQPCCGQSATTLESVR